MAEPVPSDHVLVGTWVFDAEEGEWSETEAVFTVTVRDGSFDVIGVDERDGETFVVSAIEWDGRCLRFESLMPSTGWRTRHVLRSCGADQVEHEVTLFETWKRR
jgi:hypothetical protein